MSFYANFEGMKLNEKSIGVFVAFEGPDGAGKDTLMNAVLTVLRQTQSAVTSTREPYFPSIQAWISEGHTPTATALAMLGDRIDHLADCVIPALNENHLVLTSRYDASTVVYNLYYGGVSDQTINLVFSLQARLIQPDLYVYATAPTDVLVERTRKPREAGETTRDDSDLDTEFLAEISEGYEKFFEVYSSVHPETVLRVSTDVDRQGVEDLAERIASRILEIKHKKLTAAGK